MRLIPYFGRSEAPVVQQMYQQYQDQGLMVLAPGWNESQSSCLSWVNMFSLTYEVLSDVPPSVSLLFIPGSPYYFPHNSIIDQDQILPKLMGVHPCFVAA